MPEFYNALEFMSNEDGNNILSQFVSALGALSIYSRHQEQQKVQLDFHDGRSFVPPEHAGFGIEAYKHEFHSGDVTKEIYHSVAEQLRLGLQY